MRSRSRLRQTHSILLVEDDVNYAKLVSIFLEQAESINYKTTHCTRFNDACELIRQGEEFAAVLLDLSLPDSDGFDTLAGLLKRFPKLNVIVMTGQSDKQLGLEAVKAGAQDFLVKSELDKDQLEKVLRYSIERSQILLRLEETQQIARIGHWECSPSEHVFYASEEVYRIFGIPHDRSYTCEEILESDNPFAPLLFIQELSTSMGKLQKDCWIKTIQGEERFVTTTCTVTKTEDSSYLYYGIIQDITERKQAEEIRKARDLAKHETKVREQLIANVSHEMRTPMNAILGMSNLLLKTELDEEQGKFVHAIHRSSDVLLNIVNDILTISSLQNDQLRFTPQPIRISDLMQNLRNLMMPRLAEKGLRLHLHLEENLPELILADGSRLNQILYNLIGNAIKFTEEGEVKISVDTIDRSVDKVSLQFEIRDTGIGIDPAFEEKIFLPFTRGEVPGKVYEGTGLGLSIAKSLIEQQGGRIWLESKLGKGTAFYFDLTFEIPEASVEIPEAKVATLQPLPENANYTLLLVEDHPINRFMVKKILEKQCKNVTLYTAEDGDKAIELLAEREVDLIFMDLQMPNRDGPSTLEHLKNDMSEQIARIPVIAMTAHANIALNEKYLKLGFDDYLLKPFSPEQLLEKIQHFLLDN